MPVVSQRPPIRSRASSATSRRFWRTSRLDSTRRPSGSTSRIDREVLEPAERPVLPRAQVEAIQPARRSALNGRHSDALGEDQPVSRPIPRRVREHRPGRRRVEACLAARGFHHRDAVRRVLPAADHERDAGAIRRPARRTDDAGARRPQLPAGRAVGPRDHQTRAQPGAVVARKDVGDAVAVRRRVGIRGVFQHQARGAADDGNAPQRCLTVPETREHDAAAVRREARILVRFARELHLAARDHVHEPDALAMLAHGAEGDQAAVRRNRGLGVARALGQRRDADRAFARGRGGEPPGDEAGGDDRRGDDGRDPCRDASLRASLRRRSRGPARSPARHQLERERHVVRGLPALVRILAQALADHAVEPRRRQRLELRDRARLRRHDRRRSGSPGSSPSNARLPVAIS